MLGTSPIPHHVYYTHSKWSQICVNPLLDHGFWVVFNLRGKMATVLPQTFKLFEEPLHKYSDGCNFGESPEFLNQQFDNELLKLQGE